MAEDIRLKGGLAAVHAILREKERKNDTSLSELVTPARAGRHGYRQGAVPGGWAGILCVGNESPNRPRTVTGTRSMDNF